MKHVCRICLTETSDLNFVALKTDEPSSQIKMQLSICVPEMVVDLVKNPVFCECCISALHSAYNFKSRCLQTEEYILNYSRNILNNKIIDINDLLYDLHERTTNDVGENYGEGENTRNKGFAATAVMLSDEELGIGQNFNTECNTNHSIILPLEAANKINNISNVTANKVSQPAIRTTADELNSLLGNALRNPAIQPRVFIREGENKDITIKEEDIAVPKVEAASSYERFEDNLFEDADGENHTVDVKSIDTDGAILKTNIETQSCFVKLTRLPDSIVYKHKRFICKVCKFTTRNKFYLKTHELIHDKSKWLSCALCNFHTVYKSSLEMHMRTHTGEKPFSCNVCTYRTAQQSNLQSHLRIHTGEKPFACKVCTYRAAQKSYLKRHLCVHTSSQNSSLQNCLQRHTGEKPFACNVCTYRTTQKSNLERHIQTHTGEKPFACNVCTFCCARKSTLKRHLQIHTGEKPFACIACNFRFAQNCDLQKHLRTHSGERPFACNVCTFRSLRNSSLQDHLRIHTGEKPFACNMCNYRSSHKSGLRRHLLKHS